MRFTSLTVVGCLAITGCFGGGNGDGGSASGDTSRAAAEALTKAVSFLNGTRERGALPGGTTSVSLSPAPGSTVVPGMASLMSFSVDDPDSTNPVAVSLVQFQGASEHFEVTHEGADAGPSSSEEIELSFSIDADVCEKLCNRIFDVEVKQAVRLADGEISEHATTTLRLDCRETGKASFCRKGAGDGPTAGTGGNGEAGGDSPDTGNAESFLDALAVLNAAVCECRVAGAAACDQESDPCALGVLERHASRIDAQLECMTEFAQEQTSCVENAGCDIESINACDFVSASDEDASPFDVACGALPEDVQAELDACTAGFICANGQSVQAGAECDGVPDCADESDEAACGPETFACFSSDIILTVEQLCDGVSDCPDSGDEQEICAPCATGEETYYAAKLCDGVADCSDGTDEMSCEIPCLNGGYVPVELVCNGTDDCGDGTDEIGCMSGL